MTSISDLPRELLACIFSVLDEEPAPSSLRLNLEPTIDITSSETCPLKSVSLTSKLWRAVAFPMLFKHTTLRIPQNRMHHYKSSREFCQFTAFLLTGPFSKFVQSFTLQVSQNESPEESYWLVPTEHMWEAIFKLISPSRVTIVGSPDTLQWLITGGRLFETLYHNVLTNELHILSLERKREANPSSSPGVISQSNPLQRGWTQLTINEGPLQRYHNQRESPPSIIPILLERKLFPPSVYDFSYTSCWPPPLHLSFIAWNLPRISRFYCQIVPRGISTASINKREREILALWDSRNLAYYCLMQYMLSTTPMGNFKYLQEFESGDQTHSAAFALFVQHVKSLKEGWYIESDGVLVRDSTETLNVLSDGEDSEELSIFQQGLRRWAWNGTTELPANPIHRYR